MLYKFELITVLHLRLYAWLKHLMLLFLLPHINDIIFLLKNYVDDLVPLSIRQLRPSGQTVINVAYILYLEKKQSVQSLILRRPVFCGLTDVSRCFFFLLMLLVFCVWYCFVFLLYFFLHLLVVRVFKKKLSDSKKGPLKA